ncbi:unnamed protein product [Rhodiola kirilowii]
MGRSTSCLRIVSCASDPAADQDEPAPAATESKRSTDKRRWSFRKRSATHKVPSNSLSSDAPSSGHKGSVEPESETATFEVLEKITLLQHMDEKSPLSSINPDTNNLVEKDNKLAFSVDESIIVVTQAAIRSFLAQKELYKLKSIVMLQGAVRGHLVRRHAVGTLLCLKAIVKIQNLARARKNHARLERSCMVDDEVMLDHEKVSEKTQGNGDIARPEVSFDSFQNLLTNGFANKLLGSVPKNSHTKFKCDLSNPNAAWNWMERWTSVASPNLVESREQNFRMHQVESRTVNESTRPGDNDFDSDINKTRHDTQSIAMEMQVPVVSEEICITECETQTSPLQEILASVDNCQKSPEAVESNSKNIDENLKMIMDSLGHQPLPLDSNFHREVNSVSGKPEVEQQREDPTETAASQLPEVVGKKNVMGPRKASNPAFIAAQTKFEELSLTSNSAASDSNNGISPTGADTLMITKSGKADHTPPVQGVGLECDIEHSTPLAPDCQEYDDKGKDCFANPTPTVPDEDICMACDEKVVEIKVQDVMSIPVETENSSGVDVTSAGSTEHVEHDQKIPDLTDSDLQTQLEAENTHQLLIPDSQVTSSGQVLPKSKKRKSSKGSSQKNSPSAGKTSPLTQNVPRKSFEKLFKDEKPRKKCSSFGPVTPDRVDPESNKDISVSVPSYMQATESAKAKASQSPKSSPNVREKSLPPKKRQSEVNGRQGSPKLQRSPSQVQRPAKSNGTPPQDKKRNK